METAAHRLISVGVLIISYHEAKRRQWAPVRSVLRRAACGASPTPTEACALAVRVYRVANISV